MSAWTERDGSIWIETRRQGVLSPLGHDLRLEVGRFAVELSPEAVRATVETTTVRVRAALDGDDERPGSIGRRDRARIERKITEDVLQTRRHPQAHFESRPAVTTAAGYRLEGTMSLLGVTRSVTVDVHREEGRLVARLDLRTSDYGVGQVTALLGALKVRDTVRVVVTLPEP